MNGIISNFDNQVQDLHQAKAAMAPGLTLVVKEIVETGENPENTLKDIIKLARMLDIAAPAPRKTPDSYSDPKYNLLEYIKRNVGKLVIREINADELLFDEAKPFTCISQVDEILEDVSDKLNRHYMKQVEYAA